MHSPTTKFSIVSEWWGQHRHPLPCKQLFLSEIHVILIWVSTWCALGAIFSWSCACALFCLLLIFLAVSLISISKVRLDSMQSCRRPIIASELVWKSRLKDVPNRWFKAGFQRHTKGVQDLSSTTNNPLLMLALIPDLIPTGARTHKAMLFYT